MLKIEKFPDVCMTGGIMHTPSYTKFCKLFNFQLTFFPRAFYFTKLRTNENGGKYKTVYYSCLQLYLL